MEEVVVLVLSGKLYKKDQRSRKSERMYDYFVSIDLVRSMYHYKNEILTND